MDIQRPVDASPSQQDAGAQKQDSSPLPDLRTTADGAGTSVDATADTAGNGDGRVEIRCAQTAVDSSLYPVRGTVRGPKVEADVCDNGVGTHFLDSALPAPNYEQIFYTDTGFDKSLAYGFLIHAPANARSATLTGWAGAQVAEVGTYDSTANCGTFDFEVTLPIPAGVRCPTPYFPCDPGCQGVGEMMICTPAPARLYYVGRSSLACASAPVPAQGSWTLTLTSVSPRPAAQNYWRHETHGNLKATLVNRDDPSDSVVLNLDF